MRPLPPGSFNLIREPPLPSTRIFLLPCKCVAAVSISSENHRFPQRPELAATRRRPYLPFQSHPRTTASLNAKSCYSSFQAGVVSISSENHRFPQQGKIIERKITPVRFQSHPRTTASLNFELPEGLIDASVRFNLIREPPLPSTPKRTGIRIVSEVSISSENHRFPQHQTPSPGSPYLPGCF